MVGTGGHIQQSVGRWTLSPGTKLPPGERTRSCSLCNNGMKRLRDHGTVSRLAECKATIVKHYTAQSNGNTRIMSYTQNVQITSQQMLTFQMEIVDREWLIIVPLSFPDSILHVCSCTSAVREGDMAIDALTRRIVKRETMSASYMSFDVDSQDLTLDPHVGQIKIPRTLIKTEHFRCV